LTTPNALDALVTRRDVNTPAGHEVKAKARKSEAEDEAEAQKFFEAETRHIREQLSVYEHED